MQKIKKLFAIFILLAIFPLAWAVGKNFVTNSSNDIYAYIPQESDIVIEINSRNFIAEIMYQRIYNEQYMADKVEVQEEDIPSGIDYFSKVIIFRESWANEHIWMAIVAVNNKSDFTRFVNSKIENPHVVFGEDHAIIQMTSSSNQAELDKHLANIANKNIKPFTARVDLQNHFDQEKEINCFVIPQSSNKDNQLIDGFLSMDFHNDHIDVDGEFTTVSEFDQTETIAYPIDNEAALSLRSSLNVFNSIWWFSKEKIEDVPQYSQLAIDYNGMNIFLCNRNWGYPFPFKSFPDMEMRFDTKNGSEWLEFFDTITAEGKIKIDTTTNGLITEQGAFFQYNINDKVFELSRNGVNFEKDNSDDLYFDFQMKISDLLDNTKFSVDEDNPPSIIEQNLGMVIAEDMIADLHAFDNIEQIIFQLRKGKDTTTVKANGKVQMKNKEGQSIVESMFFITEALLYVKEF
ncbi:MAG: hypothetical protein ABJG68_06275 [Crocinitomicaceae bacterium]